MKKDQAKGTVKDIVAKRKTVPADMKDALRTADEHFRAAADASLDSLFVAKGVRNEAGQLVDFECIDVNGTALKLLGLAKEKVIGQKLWGLLPVNREAFFDKYAQVLATGLPLEEEFPFDTAETKAKWLRHQVVRAGDGIAVFARDVTLRKEAESKLKESEERLRLAMSIAHMGAWTYDLKSQTFSLSEGTGLVFGLPPGEGFRTLGELVEAVHPADRDMLVRVMAESRENATPLHVEFRTTWPDGTLHWVGARSDFIRDEQGVPERGIGIVMDITERKQVDGELREQQIFLDNVVENIPNMIFVKDAQTLRFVRFNKAGEQLLGYAREELIGKSDYDFFPKAEADFFTAKDREVLDQQRLIDIPQEAIKTKVQGERILHTKKIPILNDDGTSQFLLGISEDITELKVAEQKLVDSEQRFRSLVEQAITGIYIIQDDKLAYVNPRFAEIFGYASADELIGRDSVSLVVEKDRSAVLNKRRRVEGEISSLSYDFTGLRKDGSLIEVGVHSNRATYQGRPAVIGMLQDVSEKKRAEEEIRRYVEQIKTAFMSTVEVATTLSEMRDPYTAGHERRVAEIAVAIGAELGFDASRQEGLRVAGYLHDIGKMTIPAEILSKPGKISAIEFQLIQGHAQAGYDVLKDVKFPWPVAQVALQHQERMDGSGYPQGLKGEAILLEARIVAVADVVEAMHSHRPYRPALGIDVALAEIERLRGAKLDTQVVDACLKLFRDKGYKIQE